MAVGNLVLSRELFESCVIGEGENRAVVTVVEIRGNKVRLAIQAERGVPIHRSEVRAEIDNKEMNLDSPL